MDWKGDSDPEGGAIERHHGIVLPRWPGRIRGLPGLPPLLRILIKKGATDFDSGVRIRFKAV
jgi:hypothetical protein